MSLQVKVSGVQKGCAVTQAAHTLDISRHGVRLSNVPLITEPGQIVTIHHGENRAKFRVAWVGIQGTPSAGQSGLRTLEGEPYIWAIDLPVGASDEHEVPVLIPDRRSEEDRRASDRFDSGGGVQCWKEGEQAWQHAKLGNLSKGGCFIESRKPWPVGTKMRIQFIASGLRIRAKAEVRTSVPEEGMGVRFVEFTEQDGQKLEGLLNSLIPKVKEGSSSPLMSHSDMLALKLERWFQQNEQLSREQFVRILTGRDQ